MTAGWFGGRMQRLAMMGAILALSAPLATGSADARSRNGSFHSASVRSHARVIQGGMSYARYSRGYSSGGRLQCVPFARDNSGIELSGNAGTWWNAASGVYERGSRPEVGSVLNFRSTGRIRMGHVAVVSNVIDGRNVEIDHANWSGRGAITRNMRVIDVSPANDWTAVRVALASTGDYGSVYPTYGFIYDRPDRGTMIANTAIARSPSPMLAAAPRDFRPSAERVLVSLGTTEDEEVAEAADDMPRVHRAARSRGHVARVSYFMPASRSTHAAQGRSSRAVVTPVSARNNGAVHAPGGKRSRHRL